MLIIADSENNWHFKAVGLAATWCWRQSQHHRSQIMLYRHMKILMLFEQQLTVKRGEM